MTRTPPWREWTIAQHIDKAEKVTRLMTGARSAEWRMAICAEAQLHIDMAALKARLSTGKEQGQ